MTEQYTSLEQEITQFSIKYLESHINKHKNVQKRYPENSQSSKHHKEENQHKNTFEERFHFSVNLSTEPNSIKSQREAKKKHDKSISFEAVTSKVVKQKNNSSKQKDNSSKVVSHLQVFEKTIPRIPIQFYEERDIGCLCDRMKGRVVYRGYAPKNSYFYLNSIRQFEFAKASEKGRSFSHDYDLEFNSKFQSGNLSAAVRISKKEYNLVMREDTNTHGLKQWYYFSVRNNKALNVKFKIFQFSKHYSLYRDGMKPYFKTQHSDWHQGTEDVKYEYDDFFKCFFLEFNFDFRQEKSTVLFATLPPYTYTQMLRFIETVPLLSSHAILKKAGLSLAGLEIPLIEISSPLKNGNSIRKSIIVLSRTHPAETCSNFALESFVQKILSPESKICSSYQFYIFPMVNPDGVFLGNHRTSIIGMDLNRKFNVKDIDLFPEIEAIRQTIASIQTQTEVEFLIDLHGHSAQKNIFAYGEEHQIGTSKYLKSRILPKILSENLSSFKYNHCIFRAIKQKKNTARVYFSNKCKINSITFEQSYGLLDEGAIGIQNWKNFGTALAVSLEQYKEFDEKEGEKQLEAYLHAEIEMEKMIKHRKEEKKLLLLVKENNKTEAKMMTDSNQTQYEGKSKILKKKSMTEEDDKSINSSELSSGDQDKQLRDHELEEIRKQIMIGCFKEKTKRELYNVADRKLELKCNSQEDQPIMHEQKMSIMPRILKMQMKSRRQHSGSILDLLVNSSTEKDRSAKKRISEHKICLPNIQRYLS